MSNFLSVPDAAKMVKRNRTTLYKKINAGELSASKNKNGMTTIEVSELLRVFDIPQQSTSVVDSTVDRQSTGQQIDYIKHLEQQLNLALKREEAANAKIDNLHNIINTLANHRLEVKPEQTTEQQPEPTPQQSTSVVDSTVDNKSTGQQIDTKNNSRDSYQDNSTKRKKRSLFDRVSKFLE